MQKALVYNNMPRSIIIFDYEIKSLYEMLAFGRSLPSDFNYAYCSYANLIINEPGKFSKDFLEESIEAAISKLKDRGLPEKAIRKRFEELRRSGGLRKIVKEIEEDGETPLRKQDLTSEAFFLNGNLEKLVFYWLRNCSTRLSSFKNFNIIINRPFAG